MKKYKLVSILLASTLTGCVFDDSSEPVSKRYIEGESLIPMLSKQKQIENSVDNDYETFRKLNHNAIKKNNENTQLMLLQNQVGHNVMDLISNLDDTDLTKPVIIRPVSVNLDERYDSTKGQVLLESLLELHFNKYGFTVFNDRKPKGRLSGEEFVLDSEVIAVNDKIVLQVTLKPLDSNKVTALQQSFISTYFFKDIQDGVEVWSYSRSELPKP